MWTAYKQQVTSFTEPRRELHAFWNIGQPAHRRLSILHGVTASGASAAQDGKRPSSSPAATATAPTATSRLAAEPGVRHET